MAKAQLWTKTREEFLSPHEEPHELGQLPNPSSENRRIRDKLGRFVRGTKRIRIGLDRR